MTTLIKYESGKQRRKSLSSLMISFTTLHILSLNFPFVFCKSCLDESKCLILEVACMHSICPVQCLAMSLADRDCPMDTISPTKFLDDSCSANSWALVSNQGGCTADSRRISRCLNGSLGGVIKVNSFPHHDSMPGKSG